MKNAFIIGSVSQENDIINLAESIKNEYDNVEFVTNQPTKEFITLVEEAFEKIEKSDVIMVLTKPDKTIGKGTTYELVYAKKLNKQIKII